ncbi:MAG: hypothetical protein IKB16_03330 [Lentisphaeria bacterium]|nr:hypothetical protein [Lentisphaeria bacterium]
MKKMISALLFGCLSGMTLTAQNLIKDPDINKKPLSSEFRICEDTKIGTLTQFVEDYTWNHCLKLELKKYSTPKNGRRSYALGVLMGGDKKTPGFAVKPDCTYHFSVEVKGKGNKAMFNVREYGKNYHKKKKASLHVIKLQKDWTVYTGTFKTSPKATHAALELQFWGNDSAAANFTEKPGDYILIDKIKIREVKNKPSILQKTVIKAKIDTTREKSVIIAGKGVANAANIVDFKDLREDKPARYPATGKVYYKEDGLYFDLAFSGGAPRAKCKQNGNGVWQDDVAEIFIDARPWGGRFMQLVTAAGSGRWTGNGVRMLPDKYHTWSSRVTLRKDGWNVLVHVPFKTIGWKKAPAPGTLLRFNICRERHVADHVTAIDYTRGNRLAGHALKDNSCFAFPNGMFSDTANWGYLFVESLNPYLDKAIAKLSPGIRKQAEAIDRNAPGKAVSMLEQYIELDRMEKLSKEKFIITNIPLTTDPAIPFLPEELNSPVTKLHIKAAINEQTSAVFALANMTNQFEEYQVRLIRGWERLKTWNEFTMPAPGLKQKNGIILGKKNYTLRRGVAFRDSNQSNAGKRYDILDELTGVSSVPVPPKQAGLIYLQFDCHDLQPGIYTGKLLVTPLSSGRFIKSRHLPGRSGYDVKDDSKTVDITLEVLPFALREPSTFPLNGFRTVYTDHQLEFMKKYDYVMYMITPWHFNCTFNADGSIKERKPAEYLIPHIRYIAQNVKNTGKIPPVFAGYSCYDIWKRVHVKKQFQYDTPEYWKAWRTWLQYMDDVMQQNGVQRNRYTVEVFDEPNPKKFSRAEVKKVFEEAKKAVPGIHLTMTNGERHYYDDINHLVDNWIFGQHIFGEKQQMRKPAHFASQKGKISSMYACGTSMRQDLQNYNRILPWKAAYSGSDYVSLYQFFEQLPALDFRRAPEGGVAYDTGYSMVPSIRLELLRTGMNDIRYLKELELLAKGTPQEKEVAAFIRKTLHEIAVVYPHDPARAVNFREEVIKQILKITKK